MLNNDNNASRFSLRTIVRDLDRNELNAECQRWALAHGFVQRCFTENDAIDNDSSVTPYPFTIYPSPFPRNEYERACRIQDGINLLVQRLAFDLKLMDSIFRNFIECDPFVRRLRDIYHQISQLPYKSVAEACIIRADYMLQQQTNTGAERTRLRLIEINTIAVGLGATAKTMHAWHKQFLTRVRPELLSQLPENDSHDLIVNTLFESWKIYNKSSAIILFVIPEREFNIGDQMLIETGLLSRDNSSLLVRHATLIQISEHCSLDSHGTLYYDDFEVALVYYRSTYDPKHFYTEDIWQAYIMLESSRAIKCPSLRYHLAGMKCFQLALMNEPFLREIFQGHEEYLDDIRGITEDMFTIDQAGNDSILQQRILDKPESFYLKQSREGGGNVYCGPMLKTRLDEIITAQQSNRYFLMSRVYAPSHSNFIRLSQLNENNEIIVEKQINGELGIFGSLISVNGTAVHQHVGGSLLRSKPANNVEGGIACGQGCIDSVLLV